MYLLRHLGGRVQFIEVTALLEHNQLPVGARELDIIVREIRYLRSSLRLGIVNEYIHGHIPVGSKINLVAHPHREYVLSRIVSNL